MQIQPINNKPQTPTFGRIIFKNKPLWIKHGREFLSDLRESKDLKTFAQNNPNKDIIFNAIPVIFNKPIIEFNFIVRKKGIIGAIKSSFLRPIPLGEKKFNKDFGIQVFKTKENQTTYNVLNNYTNNSFKIHFYRLFSETMPQSLTKAQKEIETDLNSILAPPYGKISYYHSSDINENKQRKAAVETIKELTGEKNIAGDFRFKS